NSQMTETALAREQVRHLLNLTNQDRGRLDTHLGTLRDQIGQTHLGWMSRKPQAVNLSLFAFDEGRSVMRVISTTFIDQARRSFELPWGAGVVGWTMRRRRPSFVDVNDRGDAAIYLRVPGIDERYVFCVPIPLPSSSERPELIQDPSV